VGDAVTEVTGRIDYLDALAVLTRASGVLLLGSSEPHYTASKLFPAMLARVPILALFHEASSVVSILAAAAHGPSVRVVAYGDDVVSPSRVSEVARHLIAMAGGCLYRDGDVNLASAADVSAASLGRALAGVLDRVAA
jgi:hypothetical protein